MSFQFKKISIIGVGLMGGSLGLALKKQKIASTVIGLGRNPKKLDAALKVGAIDIGMTDWEKGVEDSELVVICTPVCKILPICNQLKNSFPKGCIITDVGSTKSAIVSGAEKIFNKRKNEVFFVGSHPMAGSEQFGIEAAQKNLYKNALCIVTPSNNTNVNSLEKVIKLWKKVGCNIIELSPEIHDQAVGAVSHLPHVIATSLVNTIAQLNGNSGNLGDIAASGFRDTTRIASSHPRIWTDICLENQKSVLLALDKFEKEIREFKKLVSRKDAKKLFNKFNTAKIYRDDLYK